MCACFVKIDPAELIITVHSIQGEIYESHYLELLDFISESIYRMNMSESLKIHSKCKRVIG